jgi:flagellin
VAAFFGTPAAVGGSNSSPNTGLSHVVGTATATQGTTATDQGLTRAGLTGATPTSGTSGVDNTGWSTLTLTKGINTIGNNAAANTGIGSVGLVAALTHGFDDAPTTVQSIALAIQTRFSTDALVTVSTDNKISIASTTKGANSSVLLNATANSVYGKLNLTSPASVLGQNSSLADVVNNLNAQFSANGTAYQAAGLTAVATKADGTVDGVTPGNNVFISIQSNNGTQFRLNAVGAAAVATKAAVSSTVTVSSLSVASPITVTLNSNDKFQVAVDGLVAQTLQIAAGLYTTSGALLTEVQTEIAASVAPINGLAGKVTAGWDAATQKLTLTSVATGTTASVVTSAVGGNTGLGNLGFAATTSTGQLFSATENTGFGVAGRTFAGATPSSTGTAMSAFDAYGTSNSTAFTFSAMKFGSDKQALTFSATDSNGVLETQTIALQNNLATNRAGVSIDSAVAYINQQLQQSISNPALQKIVAVKEVVGGAEEINFVSSLSNFTVGVAATANGDGLNAGLATQRLSATNGAGANMSVDTQAGAEAAVTALATAIAQLGSAQAAVGKGENELGYAVSLAQSQITNFSAAESQIRDANVAQEAANLSKAQVLSQASIAAMAQANSAPQAVLTLLRG